MHGLLQYKAWALNQQYFNRMYPLFKNAIALGHNLIEKKKIEDYHARIETLAALVDPSTDRVNITYDWMTGKEVLPTSKVNGKTIAMIPIIGPLTKYGDACSYGMQDYGRWINMAMKDSTIDAVVLIGDGPGGTVDGTPELGNIIYSAEKPVVFFGDGMVASALMWIASQTDLIVGNKNNPTEFGSIGVLMVHEDYSNVIEAGNYPNVEIIRAPGSEEKALVNPFEPLTDELRSEIKGEMKGMRADFIGAIKSGRGDKLNADYPGLFSGKMFDINQAKAAGLIDAIGTLQTALNKAAELTKTKGKPAYNEGTNNQNANTMKFPKLSSLFGFGKSKEAKEVSMKVTSEGLQSEDTASLEAAEQKVAEMESETSKLKEEATAKDKQISELTATVSEQKTQITTLEGEKSKLTEEKADLQKKLDAKPTGVATTAIPDASKEANVNADGNEKTEEGAKKYRTSADDQADAIRKQNEENKIIK